MLFLIKLVLTPALIAAVTLAGRRWGHSVSGWMMGLPLTSGPISVFLALEQGPEFTAHAALGTLGGLASVGAFCCAYCTAARRLAWPGSVAAGMGAFFLATALLYQLPLSLLPTFAGVVVFLGACFAFTPAIGQSIAPLLVRAASWDIPLRMTVATALVLLLTAAAHALGPRLTGLVTPLPIFATVVAAFTHRADGATAAVRLLRGVILGSLAFATFFLVVSSLLGRWGVAMTYSTASLCALTLSGILLTLVRRQKL